MVWRNICQVSKIKNNSKILNIIHCRNTGKCHVYRYNKTSSQNRMEPLSPGATDGTDGIKPISDIGSALFGNSFRGFWNNLPSGDRENIQKFIKSKKLLIIGGAILYIAGLCIYYKEHLTYNRINKRKRFIFYNSEKMKLIADKAYQNDIQNYQDNILGPTYPETKKVQKILKQLIDKNHDFKEFIKIPWKVFVVESADTTALTLPDGRIFLFTGMLSSLKNDDELGIFLSHEMAHTLLQHQSENLSRAVFASTALLFPIIFYWSLGSDASGYVANFISERLSSIMVGLPYSNFLENEADKFGMCLAAKANFKIEETPRFWLKSFDKSRSLENAPKWSRLHPYYNCREKKLEELVAQNAPLRNIGSRNYGKSRPSVGCERSHP